VTRPAYDAAAAARWLQEPAKATPDTRGPFGRDRARVLHSSALRRLAGKTQVVSPADDEFPRTRLTHSLETAQIGRELAGILGADPDLVDAACLAHDIGHPPFGHNGEAALDEVAAACGGFEGNAQSLRELTRLELKVVGADGRAGGLNLTRASLDATVKYPWPRQPGIRKFGVYPDDTPVFDWVRAGVPAGRRCFEAEIMDWADDVAYSVHDLEDAIVTGRLDAAELDDAGVAVELVAATVAAFPGCDPAQLAAALGRLRQQPWWWRGRPSSPAGMAALRRMTSELIARLCVAAVAATRAEHGGGPLTRYAAGLVVPEPARAECAVLKGVTAYFVMARRELDAVRARQRELVAELVALLAAGAPATLDDVLRPAHAAAPDDGARLRVVVDQVARLTDAGAVRRHAELTGRAAAVTL